MLSFAIVIAVIFAACWLHALSKELFDHSRGLTRIEKNIISLTDSATLNCKTLELLVARVNKLQAQIDLQKPKGARDGNI